MHRLTIIGKSAQPMCSRGIGAPAWREMTENVFYASQDNAWMTTAIFEDVILKYGVFPLINKNVKNLNLNSSIDEILKEPTLALLDNARVHKISEIVRGKLKNIRLEFLPPNSTAVVQPLDQGIISLIKRRYRSLVLSTLLSIMNRPRIEGETNESFKKRTNPYLLENFSILDSIALLRLSVEGTNRQSVISCFQKAGIEQFRNSRAPETESAPISPEAAEMAEILSVVTCNVVELDQQEIQTARAHVQEGTSEASQENEANDVPRTIRLARLAADPTFQEGVRQWLENGVEVGTDDEPEHTGLFPSVSDQDWTTAYAAAWGDAPEENIPLFNSEQRNNENLNPNEPRESLQLFNNVLDLMLEQPISWTQGAELPSKVVQLAARALSAHGYAGLSRTLMANPLCQEKTNVSDEE
jgi:hypothetical protein